jgi:hypothetical protein
MTSGSELLAGRESEAVVVLLEPSGIAVGEGRVAASSTRLFVMEVPGECRFG